MIKLCSGSKNFRQVNDGDKKESKTHDQAYCKKEGSQKTGQEIAEEAGATSAARTTQRSAARERVAGDVAMDNATQAHKNFGDGALIQLE